jgi:hypothetical protein
LFRYRSPSFEVATLAGSVVPENTVALQALRLAKFAFIVLAWATVPDTNTVSEQSAKAGIDRRSKNSKRLIVQNLSLVGGGRA